MNSTPQTNEKIIQENTIELLKSMGYKFISQTQMKQYRANTNQVILKDILLKQLQKINGFNYKNIDYKFSSKNIVKAIEDLDCSLNEGLSTANKKISDQLVLGNAYLEELNNSVKKSFSLKYIDFETPENNIFHFTEEFIVDRVIKNEKVKTRRPDLVLFINGIPFSVIELKKSSISTEQGISQMLRNQGEYEIPQLFKYVYITLAGNNHSVQYATVNTPKKFYSIWNEKDEQYIISCNNLITNRTPSKLDNTIYSLCEKSRVIQLIHSFIIFDNNVKKIARYQQYFAIQKIQKRIQKIDNCGIRAGGLIWHTQGSGKSLTMVMLARVIKREITNSKIIIVTDRKDLDEQIHIIFNNSEVNAKRAKSGHNLIELIQGGSTVITTIINKFETVKQENIIINDPNIFILVDESHRTQSGDMHRAMKKVFPQSCYLGFTGTPLMKKDKNTFAKFGGEIHRYTISQAVKDKAVLPLLYEGRLVEQWINDENGLDRKFKRIADGLSPEQEKDLASKWTRFQKVASSERRLEMIMFDINYHYMKNTQGIGFKAMLATSSKYEALKYHQLFEQEGDIKTAFVISAPDTREGYDSTDDENENKQFIIEQWNKVIKKYGDEDTYNNKIKDQFINGDEIELLIVVDKLLTGFDAPKADTLYIDKPLKEHNLLQAIARVNRLYDGKDFGLIIDYRGLLGDLDDALNVYGEAGLDKFDEEDLLDTVFDIKDEIAKVKTYYTYIEELFKEVINKNDSESYEVFLEAQDIRQDFYEYLSYYARALKLALSSDKIDDIFSEKDIINYKVKMKFYSELRASVKIRYYEKVDFGKYEKQMQKLLDTFISANEVNQLTKLVNIFDDSFEEELQRVVGDNAKADAILSATTSAISEKMESNPAYYEKLSLRIKEIIQQYKDKRLTEEEKLKQAKDIRAIMRGKDIIKAQSYPMKLKNNHFTRAIYDNIKEDFQILFGEVSEDTIVEFSTKIDNIFNEVSKKPDWQNNSDIKNKIEGNIEDMLWALEDKHNVVFKNSIDVIAKIRNIGINNYS
jgi:type I restriction enzyme R subunit